MRSIKPKPCEGVIETLEEMLRMAKEGEIQQVMAVSIHNDGHSSTKWCIDAKDSTKVIGEVMLAATRFSIQSIGVNSDEINY